MKNKTQLKGILYVMAITFFLMIGFFLVPEEFSLKRGMFNLVAVLGLLFLTLGIIITILSRKKKGELKAFLLLTGLSAIMPLLGTILHNFFYALAIVFPGLAPLFEFLHGAFFIIALLVAPIIFIIGIIGSLVCMRKK